MAKGGKGSFLSGLLSGLASGGGGSAVGLSIGTSSVKLLELRKAGKIWKLIHFGIVQLPEDAVLNGEIINQVAVMDAIKTLVNQVKLKTKSVCSALCGPSVIIKTMTVESSNPKELQDQVFWEAEQYIPFDMAEVVLDYHVISKQKDKSTVLLVACKEAVLDQYMHCVEGAGLKPSVMDIDFFALQNAFEANYPSNASEAVMIADIGAGSLKTVIVNAGSPAFTKEVTMGGKNLTMEVQNHLKLSYADAEMLKVGGRGQGMPAEVLELAHVMTENFANELKKVADLYYASSSGPKIAYCLLSGGSSALPDLSRMAEERLGIPVQLMNPFNSVSYDPAVFTPDYIAAVAPLAAVPMGLALRAGAK
ncbi:MAG: type IV pilus assembly protein PilM [Bdellovibrionales bacterium]|nr:type IV pilus assembly protein PilM [Bdellovibrionales bacterium]